LRELQYAHAGERALRPPAWNGPTSPY
jgi:hypothetical protein